MSQLLEDLRAFGAQLGHDVTLISGERTCDDQKRIYRELGKPLVACSYHLSGDAIDIRVIPQPLSPVMADAPGVLARMGALAKNSGFRWGGDFRDPDPTHFDDGRRVGPARCCTASNGRGKPSSRSAEGVTQTRRKRGTAQKTCRCCGQPIIVETRIRVAGRARRYKIEPDCDDEQTV